LSPPAGADEGGGSHRVLDPIDRLSEVLFGLIMALTFTGSISAASAQREEIRTMLFGAIGCNVAWGIVDAVMYLLTSLTERGRSLAAAIAVRSSKDTALAHRAIADALPPLVAPMLRPADYEHLRQQILKLENLPRRAGLTASDFRGAAGVFLLVFTSTFPLVVPFLFMNDATRALRMSHAVGVTMLFLLGQRLGRISGLGPVRMGLTMVAIGLALVGLTIALGG
jgi:VIT1/CCC1 family predicted Fe2+/Mn2+ transporter